MNKRASWAWMIFIPVLLLAGCGQSLASAGGGSLPRGVMPAARACKLVAGKAGRGFFTGPERVHLVLTTYAKGEPVESQGDISSGMPPRTLVWVVEVHATAPARCSGTSDRRAGRSSSPLYGPSSVVADHTAASRSYASRVLRVCSAWSAGLLVVI